MIRWFSPHPLKSCWLLDRWSLPLLWHPSDISAICSFWPELQISGVSADPPDTAFPATCIHREVKVVIKLMTTESFSAVNSWAIKPNIGSVTVWRCVGCPIRYRQLSDSQRLWRLHAKFVITCVNMVATAFRRTLVPFRRVENIRGIATLHWPPLWLQRYQFYSESCERLKLPAQLKWNWNETEKNSFKTVLFQNCFETVLL